jgi:hypothetical protein
MRPRLAERGVVAVSLTDGARTMLSGPAVPDSVNPFTFPYGVVVDDVGNRALVTHLGPPSVVAVNLATGARPPMSQVPRHYAGMPRSATVLRTNGRD